MSRVAPLARALSNPPIAWGNPLDDAPVPNTDALREYWRNPAPYRAEVAANRAIAHTAIDAGMAESNRRQHARWEAEALHGSENGNG